MTEEGDRRNSTQSLGGEGMTELERLDAASLIRSGLASIGQGIAIGGFWIGLGLAVGLALKH